MSNKTQLEVNDVVYTEQYGTINKYPIDRVTTTMAFCKNKKFSRKINSSGSVKIIGASTWDTHYAYIETYYYKSKHLEQVYKGFLFGFNFKNLTQDQAKRVYELIKSFKNER